MILALLVSRGFQKPTHRLIKLYIDNYHQICAGTFFLNQIKIIVIYCKMTLKQQNAICISFCKFNLTWLLVNKKGDILPMACEGVFSRMKSVLPTCIFSLSYISFSSQYLRIGASNSFLLIRWQTAFLTNGVPFHRHISMTRPQCFNSNKICGKLTTGYSSLTAIGKVLYFSKYFAIVPYDKLSNLPL